MLMPTAGELMDLPETPSGIEEKITSEKLEKVGSRQPKSLKHVQRIAACIEGAIS